MAAGLLSGCRSGIVPNPNDPDDVGSLSPETLRRNLRAITESLAERRAKGEFNAARYRQLVTRAATELLSSVDTDAIPPEQAWEYGEVLRDAQKWEDAEPVLQAAVDYAKKTKNEDRRINDTLRLAVVEAHLNKTKEALDLAKTTFDAKPGDSAPILVSILLELAPVARGKGHDFELAQILERAIAIHERTQVDSNSDAGKAFIAARPFHLRNAWRTVAELYDSTKHPDLAAKAMARYEAIHVPMPPFYGRPRPPMIGGWSRPSTRL